MHAETGNHCPDGNQADHALTIEPDHLGGADHEDQRQEQLAERRTLQEKNSELKAIHLEEVTALKADVTGYLGALNNNRLRYNKVHIDTDLTRSGLPSGDIEI